jgi:hypothetical protein
MKAQRVIMSGVLLLFLLVTGASADTIVNLNFTGTATCTFGFICGSTVAPFTGTYSLDVNTQTIVGPWSFSTPFGTLSSTATNATAFVVGVSGDVLVTFANYSPLMYVGLFFPGSDPEEIGPVTTDLNSIACQPVPGSLTLCYPDYIIAGRNTVVPEGSELAMLGLAVIGILVGARRHFALSNFS